MAGYRTRKRHQDDQLNENNNDYYNYYFWVVKTLGPDHKCCGTVALAGAKRHDTFCLNVTSAKQPTNSDPKCGKKQCGKNSECAEDLQNFVDVCSRNQKHQQDHADVGNPVEYGLHPGGQVFVERIQPKPGGERQQHEQDEEASNRPWINSEPREEQWQDDRQVTDSDDHQQHHGANGKRRVTFGTFSERWEKWPAGGTAKQQKSNFNRFVEP